MLRGHPARYVRRDLRSVYRVDPSARPLAATLTSPARRSSRVGASLPRPDPAFKDRDALAASPHGWAFHAPGRYWRAPGLTLHPHGLGQHPRQRQERARVPADDPATQHHEVRGRHLGVPHHQERYGQPAVTAGGCGAAPAGLALATRTRRGPELRPGPRGAASLWDLFPAGPSSSTLAPSPLEGPGLWVVPCPRTGKRPSGYAELTSFGVDASWPGDLVRPGLGR
jgi:hypothetical protein